MSKNRISIYFWSILFAGSSLHDSYIFEAPLHALEKVAQLTASVMIESVKEFFPELHPRVEINISQTNCWNKEGNSEMFNKWLESLNE